jgi:hypothetical protein
MLTLEYSNFNYFMLVSDNGKSTLIQTDWDYPGIAKMFGWVPCEKCNETDGTIDCKHKTASQMIYEASEYLDSKIGESIECY